MESTTLAHSRRPRARGARIAGPGTGALVLGRYRLQEQLGAGGFGVVWRAYDEQLDREVAVKRIPLAPQDDGERATREALASARLAHPAIVALYEACPAQDAFYLISELVDGDTLAELIEADELADSQVLQIGVALCGALEHAHARGVIHRDVKPQNVLVAREPDAEREPAKLTDFGGAWMSGEEVLTRTGDVLGTLAYMAPEQSEGREAGEAADLYSLALVMYEGLSGVNPVRGATPAETVRRIGRPVRSLARARRNVPRELARAIDRALAPSPRARGTLSELREALECALGDGPTLQGHTQERVLTRVEPTRRIGRSGSPGPETGRDERLRPEVRPHPHPPPYAPASHAHAPAQEQVIHEHPPAHTPRRGLPRAVWLLLAIALCAWQAAAGRAGVSLLLPAALLPVVLLPIGRRDRAGTGGWLACLLAPALGAIGLAGAFPAIAGQAPRWRMRAALGALGYWWLLLAEPLLGRHLWLGPAAGTPRNAVWEGSLSSTTVHVLAPLLSLGLLLGAALWAGAAVLLPLIVRGRSAAVDAVAAVVWSAALAAATPALAGGLARHAAHPSPRGLIVGAVLGGALALAARALRGPV